ncbi:MAG: hypothetical protein K2H23_04000 [Oscillospiraceae bacterium]|nr:hypothetical protein [Oscillospiraceae bacterium]
MKNKRIIKTIAFIPLYALAVIFASFIAVFIFKGLGDYNIYKSHSWIETEAQFVGSEEYQTTEKIGPRRHGRTRNSVIVTRYKWEYQYEINGSSHSFTIEKKKESSPENKVKYIIVAEDDNSLYLSYKNGGVLKAMLVIFPLIGILIFSAVLAVILALRKKLLKILEE